MTARRPLVRVGGRTKQLPTGDSVLGSETTDGLAEGTSNLYFTAARVRALLLTGLDLTVSTAVAATDSLLAAFGKLQAQVSKLIALAPLPTDTTKTYTFTPGTGWVVAGGGGFSYIHLADEKASGTSAGDSVSGSYVTRDLTVVRSNTIAGASLASSAVTIPAGSYIATGYTTIGSTATTNKARLYNVTASAVIGLGEVAAYTGSIVSVEFTISTTATIRLEQRFSTARTGGMGQAASYGDAEVYSELLITKVS